MARPLTLRLVTGQTVCVPATLRSATTWVVLEQGGWFEKEWRFVTERLGRGMTVVDIGANLGLYALPLAARGARVFAYEPASATRALLGESSRMNGLEAHLTLVGCALSYRVGEGRLALAAGGGEYNSLADGASEGAAERVLVSTLDQEAERLTWDSVDFVKLDAEGEELNILKGGADFFRRFSPLVMFEIDHAGIANIGLREAFEALGYRIYRLLGDASALTPWLADEQQAFELNLFAAKPDRAEALAEAGLLCLERTDGPIDPAAWRWLASAPHRAAFAPAEPAPEYADALAAFGIWRDPSAPMGRRHASLRLAADRLAQLCQTAPNAARLASLARAQSDLGRRTTALEALAALRVLDPAARDEPFLCPCPRYDNLDPKGQETQWFAAAYVEQLERLSAHSTAFAHSDPVLGALVASPFASTEMLRRTALQLTRSGEAVPADLCDRIRAAGEVNGEVFTPERLAALWRG